MVSVVRAVRFVMIVMIMIVNCGHSYGHILMNGGDGGWLCSYCSYCLLQA